MDVVIIEIIGYFLYELSVLWAYRRTPFVLPTVVVHHVVGVALFPWLLVYRVGFCHFSIVSFTEVTAPFMNVRWLLWRAGRERTTAYFVNGVVMIVLWVPVRIGGYLYICWSLAFSSAEELFALPPWLAVGLCLGVLAGLVLNSYWFTLLIKGLIKAVEERKRGSDGQLLRAGNEKDGETNDK